MSVTVSRLIFILPFCALIELAGCAQEPIPPAAQTEPTVAPAMPHTQEERDAIAAQAKQLKADAATIKTEAARQHELANGECWKKFLVSNCLEGARQTLRQEESRARQMEREAKLLERNIRTYDAAQDAAKRDAENAKRDVQAAKKGKTTAPVELSP